MAQLTREDWFFFLLMTPEIQKRQRWEHKVIRWLYQTQPGPRASAVIMAYTEGDRALFERAAKLMRDDERLRGPHGARGFRPIASVIKPKQALPDRTQPRLDSQT